ncbi:MAG TPA: PQQ-dependent sugar dehydrogenase, partial [Blastocatellia bacterium]|nr:PQQ-dependent sugar dehydrogenase [Blastocatellia bacterium]
MTRVKFLLSCIAIIGAVVASLFEVTAASHEPARVAQDQTPLAISTELVPVFSGLADPVFLTNAHDGTNRLFVIEKPGRIRVAQPGATSTSVFLDISSRVLSSGSEQGLLGLAFHPQFATNRRFFVNYTRRNDGATVVAEYQASQSNANVADANETVLLVIAQPFANHNGGMVEFGRDGFLYIGMGDGGSANDPGNRAQNTNELLGKILRIDVDRRDGSQPYSSPADNPFAGTAGRDEIYAYGLRNPWRFSFDRVTGDLYAADVGQGAREEINIITRGGNYGWRVMEGNSCTNNDPGLCNPSRFIAPITEYNHTNGRCSITGGYVYRGTQASLPLGAYVYGDFCTGEIFLLSGGASSLLMDTSLPISSFGEDEAGEIYVVSLAGTVQRFANTNPPPPPGSFKIVSAFVRRRSSGETFEPLTTKS